MILILGETAAARELAGELDRRGLPVERKFNPNEEPGWPGLPVEAVIDAAHPTSSAQFAPLRRWCEERGVPYMRLERPETPIPDNPLVYAVFTWEAALTTLQERVASVGSRKGRLPTVFITTGSHQLDTIVHSPLAKAARLVVRVLPEGRLVQKCQDLGIPPRDIVAIQGPFSKELNRILFKSYGTDILFSRDSGPAGGTDTKIAAALALHADVVLLKRPCVTAGLVRSSVPEVLAWVDNTLKHT